MHTETRQEGEGLGIPRGMAGAAEASMAARVREVLSGDYSPERLVAALEEHPRLAHLYAQDSRIKERYTIREHTLMVLGQFEKWLGDHPLPAGVSVNDFRLLLALHDIGKPIPPEVSGQHAATLAVIGEVAPLLPFSERGHAAARVLIGADPIGDLLRKACISTTMQNREAMMRKADAGPVSADELSAFAALVTVRDLSEVPEASAILEASARQIANAARTLGVRPSEMFGLSLLYYQCDTAAYTYDARIEGGRRAYPGLDFLYEHDPSFEVGVQERHLVKDDAAKHLRFAPRVAPLVEALRSEVRTLEDGLAGH